MPIIIPTSGGTEIPPHPEGQFAARCIDVIDLGVVDGLFGAKPKVKLRFYCGESFENDEGEDRPLWVDAWFTATLHEKGNLRRFLESWRGNAFLDDELVDFDLEKVLGRGALLQLVHKQGNDRMFANISTVMKLPEGSEVPGVPEGYVREQERPSENGEGGSASADA